MIKLTIELVPESCFFSNVRDNVSKEVWDRLRKQVYRKAGNVCEVCGGTGPRWPVECHEVWEYDDSTSTQRLIGMIALCPDCHSVKHMGMSEIRGVADRAREHMRRINSMTVDEAKQYEAGVWEVWKQRSTKEWSLDVSLLEKQYGIKVSFKKAHER